MYSGHKNYKEPNIELGVTDIQMANMIANKMKIDYEGVQSIWIDGIITKVITDNNYLKKIKDHEDFLKKENSIS